MAVNCGSCIKGNSNIRCNISGSQCSVVRWEEVFKRYPPNREDYGQLRAFSSVVRTSDS